MRGDMGRTLVAAVAVVLALTSGGCGEGGVPSLKGSESPSTAAGMPPANEGSRVRVGEAWIVAPDGWLVHDVDAEADPGSTVIRILCGPPPEQPTLFVARSVHVNLTDTLCARSGSIGRVPWAFVVADRAAFGVGADPDAVTLSGNKALAWEEPVAGGLLLRTARFEDVDLAVTGGGPTTFRLSDILFQSALPSESDTTPPAD